MKKMSFHILIGLDMLDLGGSDNHDDFCVAFISSEKLQGASSLTTWWWSKESGWKVSPADGLAM